MNSSEKTKDKMHNKPSATESDDYQLEQFDLVKTVGKGTFGQVCLSLHRPSQTYHAMKILSLNHIIKLEQVDHVKNEKNILKKVNHPFLLSLTWNFIDNNYLYLLLPYICGGELFSYLRCAGRFSVSATLFYSAEIVSALDYLHSISIAYRDLKPENILLDKEGHIVITDFGFSKEISSRSRTMCGTPDYMAPEIILGKGHNRSVDWWALGVLIYEMLVGNTPFSDDILDVYDNILLGKVRWPKDMDSIAKDLIRKLLIQDSSRRLGSSVSGSQDIKDHK